MIAQSLDLLPSNRTESVPTPSDDEPRVAYIPCQPHSFAFGGFDLQMLSTLEAVRAQGVTAGKMDVWNQERWFNVVHVWGIGEHSYRVIDSAARAGMRIIGTTLLPYFESPLQRLALGLRSWTAALRRLRSYYSLLDAVAVVNEQQARVLSRVFGVEPSRVHVIPNVVDAAYFQPARGSFSERYGFRSRYALCTGNICRRKNQLRLMEACAFLGLPLVLIGNVLDGEEDYAAAVERRARDSEDVLWVKGLPNAAEALVAAYVDCAVFALVSEDETQPISALEATAMGRPVVLADKPYARQKHFAGAIRCRATSVRDVAAALSLALKAGTPQPNPAIGDCRAEAVGARYAEVYHSVLAAGNESRGKTGS